MPMLDELKDERWIQTMPLEIIFFDCDGTLSLIEGIDTLAYLNGVGEEVSAITNRCMADTGMTMADYQARLELVKPTEQQMQLIGELYIKNVTPAARDVIHFFQQNGKEVYIISAGIKSALLPFANYLGIASEHVLAVDVNFKKNGQYHHFDETSFLIRNDGKSKQIRQINKDNKYCALVGDGVSDLEAAPVVSRFIGFGGMGEKSKVKNQAEFYIMTNSLMPVLPLCLTKNETNACFNDQKNVFKEQYQYIYTHKS